MRGKQRRVGLIRLQWIGLAPVCIGVSHLIVPPSADWSFPSDHATAVTAIAAIFLIKGARLQGAGLAGLGLMIALSRAYVGLHYVGDLVGGACTGLLAALAVNRLWRAGNSVEAHLVRIF